MTEFHPHRKKAFIFRLGVTVILLMSGLTLSGQNALDNPNLESFNVTINFGEIGSYIFPAFYEDPDGLYLPVDDLLNILKIVRTVTTEGQVIKGYVETEDVSYEINYPKRFITFKDTTVKLADGDALMDMGTLYVRNTALERGFGFKIEFDFRSLSAKFSSKFELPVIKLKKLGKAREKLRGKDEGTVYDTILKRDYHWFKGGMLDWSIASSQSKEHSGETRMELGLGAELFGGETNVFLNWSNEYGMNREQQQYYWRWADNNSRVVKQVQLGRISSRSIASLLSPVDGFIVSNTPTSVRKALGDYEITDYTDPDWVVELYVNNILISYTRADASGFYKFSVPIVYGTSNMMLRFYGPGGEVRSQEKRFNMPYNMLPSGEMEYRVSGGALLDSTNAKFGKVELSYGIARWLTAGIGVEYLTSIALNPAIPFANFTFQPFSSLLITGEYAHKVRTKGTMNITLPAHSTMEFAYAKYTPGQQAIIYNYLEERSGSVSVPYKIRNFAGYGKASVRQNIYSNFNYNSGELMLSGNLRNYTINLSNFLNWTGSGNSNLYANLTLGAKFGRNFNIRPSVQYNYTTNKWIAFKTELETKVFANGHLSLRYENNFSGNSSSVNATFRCDFPFMSTNFSAGYGNKQMQASESARGSFAFGSGNKYVRADKRGTVGRSGITIEPFVDINFNGKRDKGEPFTERIKVRCSGGQVFERLNDSIIRIVGLEPFAEYTLILDEAGFESLTWRLPFKNIKVVTDPNQFKVISIPVLPMGEISGIVSDTKGNGIGRILMVFKDANGKEYAKTISEADGYFSYIGFKPGDYYVGIDSLQLRILKKEVDPVKVTVRPDVQGDVADAGNVEWRNMPGYVEDTVKEAEKAAVIPQTGTEKPKGLRVVKIVPWSMEIAVVYYSDASYCLQLGAYNTVPSAEKTRNKIKRAMPDINIELVEEHKIIKVRTERVVNRVKAIKLAMRIQSAGLLE